MVTRKIPARQNLHHAVYAGSFIFGHPHLNGMNSDRANETYVIRISEHRHQNYVFLIIARVFLVLRALVTMGS